MSLVSVPWFTFMGCPLRRPRWRDGVVALVLGAVLVLGTYGWSRHGGPDGSLGLMWSGVGTWAVTQHRLGLPFQGDRTFRAMALTVLIGGAWAASVWLIQRVHGL